ncbi:MAG: hypothetical protein AAFV93_01535 [Chloroflexota bacterium]
MTRLLNAMRTDFMVQVRNQLYAIGIGVGVLVAVVLSQLLNVNQIPIAIPVLVLLVAGGSTLLYVAGMILFEKDEGTLNAVIVTPLRTSEYLWSKIITLTTLATLESVVMVGGSLALIYAFGNPIVMPNIPILLLGAIVMGVMYTLIGIIMIVRYDKITDFLVPAVMVATLLQLPFVHFLGFVVHPAFLILPTSAPTMLTQASFISLNSWEWAYTLIYNTVLLIGLSAWAYRAFQTHIVEKVG